MRYLVTGGGGFLGSELVTELSKSKRNEVFIFDNYLYGYPKKLTQRQAVKDIIVGNIKDYYAVSSVMEKVRPDVVIHLATHMTRPESVGNFRPCAEINYLGTANLLDCCLRDSTKPKRIVFGSTEAVNNPHSHHGISKLAAEQLLESICPMAGIKLAILRFSEIYGVSKAQHPHSLLNFLVDNMLQNQPVAVFDVDKKKDYVHISDAVRASKLASTKAIDSVLKVDIGPGDPVVTKDLIEKLRGLIDFGGEFKYLSHASVRTEDSVADPAPAKQLLGFECKADLDTELQKLINKRRKDFA